MGEKEFIKDLAEKLRLRLGNEYSIVEDDNLIYKVTIVTIDNNLKYYPPDPQNPSRGEYTFQTDILIKKNFNTQSVPLVAIETKYNEEGVSSHDIIIYSTKAVRHKEIYPYLRYGLVIGGVDEIPNRFFTHNVGFDFAVALKKIDEENLKCLIDVINDQLERAGQLWDIFTNEKKVKVFSSKIVFAQEELSQEG